MENITMDTMKKTYTKPAIRFITPRTHRLLAASFETNESLQMYNGDEEQINQESNIW